MYFIKFLFKWWNRSPFLDYLICEQCKSEYLIIVEHQHFIHSTVELFVSGWEAVWRLHITFFNIHWIQIILSCQFTIVTDSSEWNSNSLHSLGCYRMDKIQKIKFNALIISCGVYDLEISRLCFRQLISLDYFGCLF